MDYSDAEVQAAPTWLGGPWGTAWFYATGLFKDAWTLAAKQAVRVRFAAEAPVDALPSLLRDGQLDPPFGEPPELTRARLRNVWETWTRSGTRDGLLTALRAAGYANVTLRAPPPDAPWWHLRTILRSPFPWTTASRTARSRWTAQEREGRSISGREKARVASLVRKWRPAHAWADDIRAVLSGALYDDGHRYDVDIRYGGTLITWIPLVPTKVVPQAQWRADFSRPIADDLVSGEGLRDPIQALADRTEYLYDLAVRAGVKTLRRVPDVVSLKGVPIAEDAIAYVPGFGLYLFVASDTRREVLPWVVAPTNGAPGRWVHPMDSLRDTAGGFPSLDASARVPSTRVRQGVVQTIARTGPQSATSLPGPPNYQTLAGFPLGISDVQTGDLLEVHAVVAVEGLTQDSLVTVQGLAGISQPAGTLVSLHKVSAAIATLPLVFLHTVPAADGAQRASRITLEGLDFAGGAASTSARLVTLVVIHRRP